jgi:hypothetical protein
MIRAGLANPNNSRSLREALLSDEAIQFFGLIRILQVITLIVRAVHREIVRDEDRHVLKEASGFYTGIIESKNAGLSVENTVKIDEYG